MKSNIFTTLAILLAAGTVVQSRRWFSSEVNCWITQEKVPASWEDAKQFCEIDDAVLASPLNIQLFDYMQTLITVHNHSAAYFIGTRAKRSDGQKVHYESLEGRRLDDMPKAVFDAIDILDLEQGDCLSMDRHGISTVSCWDNLPYICYSNETECGLAPVTTPTPTTSAPPPTTTVPPSTTVPPGEPINEVFHEWHTSSLYNDAQHTCALFAKGTKHLFDFSCDFKNFDVYFICEISQ